MPTIPSIWFPADSTADDASRSATAVSADCRLPDRNRRAPASPVLASAPPSFPADSTAGGASRSAQPSSRPNHQRIDIGGESCLPSAPPAAHCPSSNPPPLHSRGSRLGAFNCGCKRVPPVVFICPTRAISSVAGGSSFGASSFGGYSFLVYTTAAPWSSARKSTELNPPFLC
ncbi:hypothetical protein U9M48_024806 [Paspalum notatum var. saurae]|uniref:Uncharacterized protein n=1 Tax=Paspalum notatum var. saurae TaxID=547442 RepID=A0AAQ3TRG6_PASNO